MRKTIIRTLTASTIQSANVSFYEGIMQSKANDPITVIGSIEQDKALKVVRKEYGVTAQVVAITPVSNTYEISVDEFIKHAKKVDKPSPDQLKEGTE